MRNLIDILFKNNYNIMLFMMFLMAIAIESYVVFCVGRNWDMLIKKKLCLGILVFSISFGMMMIFNSESEWNYIDYDKSLSPQDNSCLVSVLKRCDLEDDFYLNTYQYRHYFEDKELVIFDDVETKDEIVAHFNYYDDKLPIFIEENRVGQIDAESYDLLYRNTNHIEKDSRLFLLDRSWKNSSRIICTQVEDQVVFLSEDLFNAVQGKGDLSGLFLPEKDINIHGMDYMSKERGESDLTQIAIVVAMFVMGWLLVNFLFNSEKKALSAFMGFPIGLFMTGLYGVVFIILKVPFRKITILGAFVLTVLVEIGLYFLKKRKIKIKSVLITLAGVVVTSALFVYLKIYLVHGDSQNKIYYGFYLVEKSSAIEALGGVIPYGILEPIIHGIAWKFRADWLYSMYPIITVCTLGILISAAYYLSKDSEKKYSILFSMIGCMMLLSNHDFLLYNNWALANSSIACAILIIVVLVLLSKDNICIEPLILFTTFAITIARVEGACYIALILSLACGFAHYRNKHWLSNVMAAAGILGWEGYLVLFSKNIEEMFWSINKGLICMVGAVVICIVPLVLKLKISPIKWITQHFYPIFTVALLVVTLGYALLKNEHSKTTFDVFLHHFATSDSSNSAGIWCFFLFMAVIAIKTNDKSNGFILASVVDYLCLIYLIVVMREKSIHVGERDSCRRMIMQIMPTAMFLISYMNSKLDLSQLFEKEKNV